MTEKELSNLFDEILSFSNQGWSWTISENSKETVVTSPKDKEYTLNYFLNQNKKYNKEEKQAKDYIDTLNKYHELYIQTR